MKIGPSTSNEDLAALLEQVRDGTCNEETHNDALDEAITRLRELEDG